MIGKLSIRSQLNIQIRSQKFLVVNSWVVLLLALSFRIWSSQTSGLMYDEPVTLHLASSVAAGQLPFIDFYEHHSPLPWYLLAPLSPYSLWRGQRLLVAIGGFLALLGLFMLSKKLWGIRAGLFTLILGTVSPLWQHQGNMIIHDSFLVIALVLAMLAWWCALQHQENAVGWLLAGFCAGLVVLSKQTGMLSALALGVGILIFTRSIKAVILFILGGVITAIPFACLYHEQYESLFNGLLGWNLAANRYLEPNPKLTPFLYDIFWANPVLWGGGMLAALLAMRHFRHRTGPGDTTPLLAVSGLIVILVLVFNWFLSRQTFGQYYLQAIPALILLTTYGLNRLVEKRLPPLGCVVIGLLLVYLGIIDPLMNALIPWTPDRDEKSAIAGWLRQELGDEVIWEPWVYYSYLAGKEFNFYYPFLSIHSVRNEPDLPQIDGKGNIPLESYLKNQNINWIVVHQPLVPNLGTFLDRLLTTGNQDWQMVRSFEVTRYASESGMQSHFWTPWWKPLTFYEHVSIWYRNPGMRKGGFVGELQVRNPTDEPYFMLEVQHRGGIDLFLLDRNSSLGRQYALNWHQTGHAFFISGKPLMLDHKSASEESNSLVISAIFSNSPDDPSRHVYRVQLRDEPGGGFCSNCVEIWLAPRWVPQPDNCPTEDDCAVMQLTAQRYESVEDPSIGSTSPQ
jgi:hypothetical protein